MTDTHPPEAASGNVLKLYIDSTSLSLVEQMADYVRCAEAPEVFKVITWLRVPLDEAQLVAHNAMYAPQMAAVSIDFVRAVRDLVADNPVGRVEIHANQTHAWRSVIPVMRALLGHPNSREVPVRLHLYDDGSLSLVQREGLKQVPDLPAALQRAALELGQALQGKAAPAANVLQSHAWHLLFDTTYHMLRRDLLSADAEGRRVAEALAAHTQDMRFDGWATLTPEQQRLYLALFGIGDAERDALQAWADDPAAWLFTGSAAWDAPLNDRLGQAQLRAVHALRADGSLPADARMGFKAHPANATYTAPLMEAFGPGTLQVPSQGPLEVLMMAGLLPRQVAGVVSSAFFNLPAERIRFAIADTDDAAAVAGLPVVQLVVRGGGVTLDRIRPWPAPARLEP